MLLCALLPSCSRQPLAPDLKKEIEEVSAVSLLGSDFTIDVISRSVISSKERALDVSAWKVDETFRSLLEEHSKERGKNFRTLALDPGSLEKALAVRESRWKKILGTHSQAALDLLLRKAGEQRIHYLFLVSPLENRRDFPLHKGNMGIYCYDRKLLKSRAYAYFFLDFSLWDVKAKKKIFREAVDPAYTQEMAFAECREVAELKEPLEALKDPVHHTMKLLVDKLFTKMGWEKTAP